MDLDAYSSCKGERDAYVETGNTAQEAGDHARSERIGPPVPAAVRTAARLYSLGTTRGWDTPSLDTGPGQFAGSLTHHHRSRLRAVAAGRLYPEPGGRRHVGGTSAPRAASSGEQERARAGRNRSLGDASSRAWVARPNAHRHALSRSILRGSGQSRNEPVPGWPARCELLSL